MKEQNIGGMNCWKKVHNLDPEIGIRKIVSNVIKDIWRKTDCT
jgi:hypothetical protein